MTSTEVRRQVNADGQTVDDFARLAERFLETASIDVRGYDGAGAPNPVCRVPSSVEVGTEFRCSGRDGGGLGEDLNEWTAIVSIGELNEILLVDYHLNWTPAPDD